MVGKSEMKFSTYERTTKLIHSRFEKIKQQVDIIAAQDEPITQVQTRLLTSYLAELKTKRRDFEGNLLRIIDSVTADEAPQEQLSSDQDGINELYVYLCSVIETLVPPEVPPSPSAASVGEAAHTLAPSHVRLPKLELKHFDGNPLQWVSFINLFDCSVHRNASVSNVAKFQYLLGVLSGEPLALIKSLNITTSNYLVAYQLLRDRYHNVRRLQCLHLNNLLDLPPISANSPKSLRIFLNLFFEHTEALKALECDVASGSNPMFSAMILRKMDADLRKKLECYRSSQEQAPHTLPEVQEMIKFLNQECTHVEDANLHLTSGTTNKPHHSGSASYHKPQPKHSTHLVQSDQKVVMFTSSSHASGHKNKYDTCFDCSKTGHKIYACTSYKSKTPKQRYQLVKDRHRCISCLGNHSKSECKSENTCFICHKPHHTTLHFDGENHASHSQTPRGSKPTATSANSETSSDGARNLNSNVAMTSQHNLSTETSLKAHEPTSTVLLGTTLIKLTSPNGITHVFRGLLDCGSQLDFVSERAAQLLGAPRSKSTANILGIGHSYSQTRGFTKLHVASLSGHEVASNHSFHILDKISANLPRTELDPEVFTKVKGYTLADPTFHLPGSIDVLLGACLYPQLFTQENHSLGPHMPHILGSHFGYILMGNAPCVNHTLTTSHHMSLLSTSDHDLHSSLMKFWEQEQPPACNRQSIEEQLCDEHFTKTHSRDSTGRYVVRLPFKEGHPQLGSSNLVAERRFYSLERSLSSNPHMSQMYHDFINEYRSLNHMVKCENLDVSSPHYFLPHHGVLKENSSTTKLRTVFDASCKTSTGTSLNDILLTGRKLQTNIADVLTLFRCHNTVFSCDIRQMYRQILLHPDDRKFQLIFWRDNPQEPLSTYQLNTVTYGLNSAPYLAIRTLHQLAEDEGASFPEAARVLLENTYVDDVIGGADTEEEALNLQGQLIQLLRCGGFELRKWVSSSTRLLQDLPEGHLETPVFLQETPEPQFTILGLHWSPNSDCFSYNINFPPDNKPTKRSVLSVIARIYDPCGFLSPCIMQAKCFMQLLWTHGLTWDEQLSPDLAKRWQTFVSHANHLADLHIPRALQISNSCAVELHGFSDASESGYAAVIYVRCELDSGECVVRQVISKTRVAPLKKVTLPRLELCGAHLLGKLVSHFTNIFCDKVTLKTTVLWCDSSIVLTWLRTPPYKLKSYVANRVAQTQEVAPSSCWRHISSSDNPADCASRGILGTELLDHPIWWNGPSWLCLPAPQWPSPKFQPVDLLTDEETKTTPLTVLTSTQPAEWDLLFKFSSWSKLQRVMAYVLRFIHNCRRRDKLQGILTPQEWKTSKLQIFKLVQQVVFKIDLDHMKNQRPCTTRLQRLSPFTDAQGLLRVGGRLSKASLPDDVRHPVILPKHHHIVHIFIDHCHTTNLHAGPQLTQALLHQEVWILSARSIIRSRIYKCVKCFRAKPRNDPPLMGDLPQPRVTPARPFSMTGTDYCGPFTVKVFNLRAVRHVKVYICVFVCLVTKAVHLEVVTDLTSEAFIATLTRFVSRRGLCSDLFSDCGTNYVGADSALRKIVETSLFSAETQKELQHFAASKGISFHFNPPSAPHQGGIWEAAVKSAKYHLRRVMGDTVLTLMDFITLTTKIEAMLNSRPLTALSSDACDFAVLTPGHFLIGAPLAAVPEEDLRDVPDNRLKHWQLVQAFSQRIWKRWQLEYLHTLQQRLKWTTPSKNLKVGDLVMIHTSTTAPLSWPLARVTAVHPGADGVVRVVDLKTQTGTLTRPAVKVFPLPIN